MCSTPAWWPEFEEHRGPADTLEKVLHRVAQRKQASIALCRFALRGNSDPH
jgi:hypothetical protein